jgi:hypothetical protein
VSVTTPHDPLGQKGAVSTTFGSGIPLDVNAIV